MISDLNHCVCQNGGTCLESNIDSSIIPGEFLCQCTPGWDPEYDCGVELEECASRPCKNNGICIDEINKFTCNCDNTGFTDKLCRSGLKRGKK